MRQQAEMRLGEAAGSSNEAEATDGIALFVRVCSASPHHLVRPRVQERGDSQPGPPVGSGSSSRARDAMVSADVIQCVSQ